MTAFEIFVPATSANLGPGFDCMGLALPFGSRFRVYPAPEGAGSYHLEGTEPPIPEARNLFRRAAARLAAAVGAPLPTWEVRVASEIPLARGLGSSASAVVGGLAAANHALGAGWSLSELLRLASEIEGHPDNVAPALFGGLCVAVSTDSGPVVAPLPVPDPPRLVVAIPAFALETAKARAALPAVVSLEDAVYNIGRAALLTAALVSGRHTLLADALSDRLHEPYRRGLVPGMPEVVAAAKEAGAYGVTLSGAGPSLLAWCSSECQEAVAARMVSAWQEVGIESRALAVGLGARGMTTGPISGSARG